MKKTIDNLKKGDKVWLHEDCKHKHNFWTYDMEEGCIVTIKKYNKQAFHIEEGVGLYPVQLIDFERTNRVRIRLTEDIEGYMTTFKEGEIFEEDKPEQLLEDDGSFTICQGMGLYHRVEPSQFKIIEL